MGKIPEQSLEEERDYVMSPPPQRAVCPTVIGNLAPLPRVRAFGVQV